MSGHPVRILTWALAMVLVAGCRAGVAAPSDSVTGAPVTSDSVASPLAASSPSPSIAPAETDCIGIAQSNDSLDPTLENLRTWAIDVVVGTVTQEGLAFWNSPTGKAPTPSDQPGEGNEFGILTPYVVAIEQPVTGTRAAGEITIVIEGGKIGCYVHDVLPAVHLTAKERYVLFLGDKSTGDGKTKVSAPLVFRALPIQADGTVLTPLDGAVSLAALSSALAQDGLSPTP